LDPKVLGAWLIVQGLTGRPAPAEPAWYSLVKPIPSINWPTENALPEQPEPEHPWHEDPSPMYNGLAGVYPSSNTAAYGVTFDSGASGMYTPQPATWLADKFILVSSPDDLELAERLPAPQQGPTNNVSPDTTKHFANPSTVQLRRSYTRHQK
jgi:hypothetical protein